MSYVDGFVAAVPTAKKEDFRSHSAAMAELFKEYGALSVVDCWGHEVPDGEVTSFPLAVKCQPDETVVFPGSPGRRTMRAPRPGKNCAKTRA